MSKSFICVLLPIMIMTCVPAVSRAQPVHPKKKVFLDVANWPTTSPGTSTTAKNFAPFRAVYDRSYKQHSGADAGAPRRDRVIVSAEETGWDGKNAIVINLIDSGIAGQKDTNARILTMFVDRTNLSLFFEIGPIPGKAKDYYIARVEQDTAFLNQITTDTQKLKAEKISEDKRGFGPSAWVLASVDLRKGKKIKLSPTYSPKGNPLTSVYAGHVTGKQMFTDGSGKRHEAWVLETTKNLSGPKINRVYLIDSPPYYLGTESFNLDTGETKPFVWLRYVDLLSNGNSAE